MPGRLEQAFHRAMIDVYRCAKAEISYTATRFFQMVDESGGLGAAKSLLAAPGVSDGFTVLWERGRLDLTVEAHVLRPEFRSLFTEEELATARRRLREYGFEAGGSR
jgi:hypothetical protein